MTFFTFFIKNIVYQGIRAIYAIIESPVQFTDSINPTNIDIICLC